MNRLGWPPPELTLGHFVTPDLTYTNDFAQGLGGFTGTSIAVVGGALVITPTLGAELLANADFTAWVGGNPSSWTVAGEAGVSEISQVGTGVAHGGGGTGSCNWFKNDANNPSITQAVLSVGSWYQLALDVSLVTSGSVRLRDNNAGITLTVSTTGSKLITGRAGHANFQIIAVVNCDVTGDNASAKALTLSSLFALRTFQFRDGTFSATTLGARVAGTQVGIVLYADANNQVICYEDGAGNVKLEKNVAGLWTPIATVAVTYVAGKLPSVKRQANSYTVSYNGVEIMSGQTIADAVFANAKTWGMFSTYAGNQFDSFSAVAATSILTPAAYSEKIRDLFGSSLIADWRDNEVSGATAWDYSGNGRDGSHTAVTLAQTGIGDGLTSALYDGSTSVSNVYSASLNTTFNNQEGSLAIWGKVRAASVWADAAVRELFRIAADANNGVLIFKNSTANQLVVRYTAGGTVNAVTITTSTTAWFQVWLTWSKSANRVRAYFNGAQSGADIAATGVWAGALNSSACVLGALGVPVANVWDGVLAHALILNREATAAEIVSAYSLT